MSRAMPVLFGSKFSASAGAGVFPHPTEGAFAAAWHKVQWEAAVLALCYVMQSDVLQTIMKCAFSVVAFGILAHKVCVCGV